MDQIALYTLMLPSMGVAFTLFFIVFAVAKAIRSLSATYYRASLMMGAVLVLDFLLGLVSILTVAFTEGNAKGHALVFIPVIGIEVLLSSMVVLDLFHRRDLSRWLMICGIVAFVPLLVLNILCSASKIGEYGSWTAASNYLASTSFGHVSIVVLAILFFIVIVYSYVAVLKSIRTYHRQMCSYFSYSERPGSKRLVVASVAYLAYLCSIGVGVVGFFTCAKASQPAIPPFFFIYSKSFFFIFFSFFLVCFAQQYLECEPALCTIEKIETENEGNREEGKDGTGKVWKKLPAAPADTPLMRQKLDKWQNDPEKFYLRDDINLLYVAEKLGVRPRFLSEYLNQVWGMNFNQYINNLRIEEAKRLIREDSTRSFTDIAYATGFASVAALSRTFKRITGLTPSQFRES